MKILIISGSHRPASQSSKVSKFLQNRIATLNPAAETELLDLAHEDIPFWDEGVWNGEPKWQEKWSPIKEKIREADGFIVVSPEWSGMVPPRLKNFLLLTSSDVIGHKAGLIVTVSSGRGGSYPVNELRISGYKNSKICFIPEHIIVRKVTDVLNDGPPERKDDIYIRERIDFTLSIFFKYSEALALVRSADIDFSKYPNGM